MTAQLETVIQTTAKVPINMSCVHVQLDGIDSALFTNENGKMVQALRTEIVFMLANKYCFLVLHFEHRLAVRPRSLFLTFPTTMNSCDSLLFHLEPSNPGEDSSFSHTLRLIPADARVKRILLERVNVALAKLID